MRSQRRGDSEPWVRVRNAHDSWSGSIGAAESSLSTEVVNEYPFARANFSSARGDDGHWALDGALPARSPPRNECCPTRRSAVCSRRRPRVRSGGAAETCYVRPTPKDKRSMTCSKCGAPERQMWPPTARAPTLGKVDTGNGSTDHLRGMPRPLDDGCGGAASVVPLHCRVVSYSERLATCSRPRRRRDGSCQRV